MSHYFKKFLGMEQEEKEEKSSSQRKQFQHNNAGNNSSFDEKQYEDSSDEDFEDCQSEDCIEYENDDENDNETKYDDQVKKFNRFTPLDQERKPLYLKSVYKISADTFIDLDLDSYKDQRAKDGSHISTLKEGISSTQDTFHNFNIYHIEGKSYTIADGQHRYEALKRLNKSTRKAISVWIFVYEFDEDDDEYNFELFTKINTAKGINKNELNIKAKSREMAIAIKNRFGKHRGFDRITDEKTEQIHPHWWRLSYLQLNNYIERNWDVFQNYTEEEVLERLERYNNRISQSPNTFFKANQVVKEENKTKCINFNFFLGVNFPKCFDDIFKEKK
jgi:hypothetical protein